MFFLRIENKSLILQSQIANGTLTERLGNGLQNREEQFDSARYLLLKEEMCRPVAAHLFCI